MNVGCQQYNNGLGKKWIVDRLKSKEKGLDFIHNICYNCDILVWEWICQASVLANLGKKQIPTTQNNV